MKRSLRLAARLYPRCWRDRYGDEFEALLDDVRPTWRDAGDLLGGAIQMHLTTGSSYLKFSAGLAVCGLLLGAYAAFSGPRRYISTGVVRVESEPGADDRFQQAITEAVSRGSLAEIIQRPSLNLYRDERNRYPMEDIVQMMRKDVRILLRKDGAIEISVGYSDAAKAEGATRALMNRIATATEGMARSRAAVWKQAWPNDEPPPPQRVVLVSEPQLPDRPVRSGRPAYLAFGAVAGLLAAWLVWRPKRNFMLAGFALLGAVLAIAGSFTISDRYTSSAVLRLGPPFAPKRLWPAFAPEPAAERVQRLLSEATGTMRNTDLRIATAGRDAFLVSFTGPDRYQAQRTVREAIGQLVERHANELRASANDAESRRAVEMAAGPTLEVLDPATLPETPVFPNRLAIGALGLPVGLLAGVLVLRRRRAVQAA